MKVFILAAGLGTRLFPLTKDKPKCLVEIKDKVNLLRFWLDKISLLPGIEEVIINTHHHAEKVRLYLNDVRTFYYFTITEFYEPKLLGSAGTLWANREKLISSNILVIYSDNYSEIQLDKFYDCVNTNEDKFVIGVFRAEKPGECGIFNVDENGNVIDFIEKPKNLLSNLANAGIYGFNGDIYLEKIMGKEFDIGFDVLRKFLSITKLFEINGMHVDVGTIKNLKKIQTYLLKGDK